MSENENLLAPTGLEKLGRQVCREREGGRPTRERDSVADPRPGSGNITILNYFPTLVSKMALKPENFHFV